METKSSRAVCCEEAILSFIGVIAHPVSVVKVCLEVSVLASIQPIVGVVGVD